MRGRGLHGVQATLHLSETGRTEMTGRYGAVRPLLLTEGWDGSTRPGSMCVCLSPWGNHREPQAPQKARRLGLRTMITRFEPQTGQDGTGIAPPPPPGPVAPRHAACRQSPPHPAGGLGDTHYAMHDGVVSSSNRLVEVGRRSVCRSLPRVPPVALRTASALRQSRVVSRAGRRTRRPGGSSVRSSAGILLHGV